MSQVPPMDARGAAQALQASAQDFVVRLNRTAFRYDVLTRGGTRDRPDSLQYSNDVVVAVFPFKHPSLAPNFTAANPLDAPGPEDSMATLGPLFLEGQLIQAQVVQDKRSPVGTFSGFFKDPDNTLLATINPGDWCMVWMCDNRADAQLVRDRIKRGEPCNGFHDGLKFVGKVAAPRRRTLRTPQGHTIRTVSIVGDSFSEFTGEVYFDPWVLVNDGNSELFTYNLAGGDLFRFLSKKNGLVDINDVIPSLVSIFIGTGPASKVAATTISKANDKIVSPNRGFLIPTIVARLLGRTPRDSQKDGDSYAQVLQRIYGLQSYDLLVSHQGVPQEARGFIPDLSTDDINIQARTTKGMNGLFTPLVAPWTGVPVWGILGQFLNPAINEMYTTLRMGPDGRVVPHFIVRQIPFTTNTFRNRTSSTAFTEFTSLPRWVLDPLYVTLEDVGKSASQRFNFVQIRGAPVFARTEDQGVQVAQITPSLDKADISRSGLRTYLASVNAELSNLVDTSRNANAWYSFLAGDWLIGGHLKYTGTLNCRGIQDPICVGDNAEFDDNAYHIERVQHTVSVDGRGAITFETVLAVTNGVDGQTGLPPEIGPQRGQHQNIITKATAGIVETH